MYVYPALLHSVADSSGESTLIATVADHEMLIIFNTDEIRAHELYSALNPNLRREGDELHLLLSYTPEAGLEPLESPRYALPMLKVERRGSVLCTRLALGPAGIAIYAAGRFPRIGSQ